MMKARSWSLYLFLVALAFGVGLGTTLLASRVLARGDGDRETGFEAPTEGPERAPPRTVEC